MRRDSSFCAKSVRYNIFTNGAPYMCIGTASHMGSFCWAAVALKCYEK